MNISYLLDNLLTYLLYCINKPATWYSLHDTRATRTAAAWWEKDEAKNKM